MLSVPPEVSDPTTLSSPFNIDAVMAIVSVSNRLSNFWLIWFARKKIEMGPPETREDGGIQGVLVHEGMVEQSDELVVLGTHSSFVCKKNGNNQKGDN
jgi:hypothetical protein